MTGTAGVALPLEAAPLQGALRTTPPTTWWRLPLIALQLAAVLGLMAAFRIESPAFYAKLGPLVFGGFVVHHLLPLRWRLRAFAVLSLGGVALVFGPAAGAWLVGVGLVLIALCHLPVTYAARVGFVVAAGLVLAAMRAGWLATPFPSAIWPILGSMFMFRMIAYLYDLRHRRDPATPARTLGYFFMLPNVCFPLFPVVDFNTFTRTYYDRDAFEIYDEGVRWMVRGVAQLLLYRVVYQYATMSPADVTTTADIVRYVLANFGLYLRVSGQFHLIVGVLHLFGFRLPETHRFFYLASSFTDFWRRINIYWKEFMQKVVFTPSLFALRKRGRGGATTQLVVATLLVFVATWTLHSYQWFWLLGSWLWSATDSAFWGILSVLLVVSVIRETRRGRARTLGSAVVSSREAWRRALATAGTFTAIAILWALWTSPTFQDFFALFRAVTFRVVDGAVVVGTLAAVAVVAFVVQRFGLDAPGARSTPGWWRHPVLAAGAPLALVWLLGEPSAVLPVPAEVRQAARDLRLEELNRQDAAQLQRGYYEQIVGVNRFNGQLWEVYARRQDEGPSLKDLGVLLWHEQDAIHSELTPFASVVYQGKPLRTNRWGMRDRSYDQVRVPNSRRIALLGQSYVMGMGVGDGETFESVLEGRLNAGRGDDSSPTYEILNFAVPRYSLFQQLLILENGRVMSFRPDAMVLVGHAVDLQRLVDYLYVEAKRGNEARDEFVRTRLAASGATPDMTSEDFHRALKPYAAELAGRLLEQIAAAARAGSMRPIFALIPMPRDGVLMDDAPLLIELARRAGFEIVDLSDVYGGHDERALVVAEWDRHPNAEGHRMIADRLHAALAGLPGLELPAPAR